MPQASPAWQTGFLVCSIVCIGWMIFSGWRAGIIRGLFSLAALLLGYSAGTAVALGIPGKLLAWLPVPGLLAQLLAGMITGFVVFISIWFLGAAMFKRTAQQRSFFLRFTWGLGGAFCGGIFGILIVLSALSGIRTVGAFSENRLDAQLQAGGTTKASFWEPPLVKLKQSIEAGETGAWIRSIDITPDSTIRITSKLGKILSDPKAAQRFIESRHVVPVVSDRAFVNLVADPGINDAAISGKYGAIITNPKVLEAIKDPGLWQKMQNTNWEAAMDEALLNTPQPAEEP